MTGLLVYFLSGKENQSQSNDDDFVVDGTLNKTNQPTNGTIHLSHRPILLFRNMLSINFVDLMKATINSFYTIFFVFHFYHFVLFSDRP